MARIIIAPSDVADTIIGVWSFRAFALHLVDHALAKRLPVRRVVALGLGAECAIAGAAWTIDDPSEWEMLRDAAENAGACNLNPALVRPSMRFVDAIANAKLMEIAAP